MTILFKYFSGLFFALLLAMPTLLLGQKKKVLPVVAFEQQPGKLTITIGGKHFANYIYEDAVITRPHFSDIMTSCGIQATRNNPPQEGDPKDHATFHPGIWLSFGDINGYDYWRLKAKVEHEMFVEQPEGGPGKGTFTVRNYYMTTDGKERVLAELVKYTILVRPEGSMLLINSTYSSDQGDFTFGDQEEMGLGVRVNTKLTVQYGKGHITNAEGLKDGKETWGKASAWIDYSGPIGAQYAGVALMPSPANYRPSWYHSRDYGLVAANLFGRDAMKQGAKSAITFKKGETFSLGYGVLIYCTPAKNKTDVAKAYQEYLTIIGKK
ncbi:hypothetical protein DYBT9275_02325 [Dyadobacter sp. CECT 9275]|uniref:Methane oxygenase PmoA n=1 Tax=Dyadobacter helix TaxID=2822344 RepID=A0A916JB42_9BACT|nr:DUF6807 family protein [Dyadobacter sp. CECT 9275]CAG4999850.1 hypothetical protein DYBT9275_02325 [Dyadobacter sp. CECT 9275]